MKKEKPNGDSTNSPVSVAPYVASKLTINSEANIIAFSDNVNELDSILLAKMDPFEHISGDFLYKAVQEILVSPKF